MDFSGVHEKIDARFNGEGSSDQPDNSAAEVQETAPQQKSENPIQENQSREETREQAQALFDLSKAEKFTFDGKEYTLDQLKKEMMLQSDYTRKTQAFAEERKVFEAQKEIELHFQADLPKILRNPQLIAELPKHYPPHLVDYAKQLIGVMPRQPQGQPQQPVRDASVTRDEIKDLITSEIGTYKQEIENQRLVSELDSIFGDLKTKYPEMKDSRMETFVLSQLQALDSQGTKITKDVVESTFRNLNDWLNSRGEDRRKEQLKQQSEANKKAKDIAPGGATPGQAPQRLKLGQVKGALTEHLKRQFGP